MEARVEEDLLGEREVPADVYYGVHTLRAIENFRFSGKTVSDVPEFIIGMVQVKKACALANEELHAIPHDKARAIETACDEILEKGRCLDQFPTDLFQGGAGTSVNMNTNEVVANLALELLGYEKGRYDIINPNDDVNHSQSTNDAYPTGMKLAMYHGVERLCEEIEKLADSFENKGEEFKDVLKMGRTQLQDAVPMSLGQEFHGWATNLREDIAVLNREAAELLHVNLGATAIGTGLNTPPGYTKLVAEKLAEVTGLPITSSEDLIEATVDNGDYVLVHAVLKRLAHKLSKTCNDLRLLSSGPRCGLHEINLPERQAGSSIMPAKVNPVIPEVVNQVCFKVIGNDVTVTMAAEAGQLELNVMEPAMADSMFESLTLLTAACDTLRTKCVDGITANREVCRAYVDNSIGIVTYLNDIIGHHNGDVIGKEAARTGKSVKELVVEKGLMTAEEVDKVLTLESFMKPRYSGKVWADDETGLPVK
ncbi:MAG: aspartate ammonia-lyase [Mobiluncus porci]|uniref:aspartate ammonia-lyase n=1 Tax=Mobiluncus porci TaxID=2652278 RepID=UPI0023F32968|nr:aspartate ammonia-lyase [Mobiluncus porci]MDD7542260.1 aspartate ammonia-lyase [Mobiluncus porci]MDY5749059.1 aspartate ammonia-lyase [Mobiluncus porci]